MADVAEPEIVPKKSKLPLLIGIVLGLALGGGGFYATWSGLLFGGKQDGTGAMTQTVAALPDIAFVPVDPLVISLGPESRSRHLRFSAQLEVGKSHQAEVAMLMPRILDVLNGYLRAIDLRELENPSTLIRIRAQMLRRVQIVTGEGRVRDLLVTEFVLN